MRKIILLCYLCIGLLGYAQSQVNIGEYFYPYITYAYSLNPNEDGDSQYSNSYRMERSGNILSCVTEQWHGLYAYKVGIVNYYVTVDPNKEHSIISNRQIHRGPNGTYQTDDQITMFILPDSNNEVKWVERQKGCQTSCSAKNVFLSLNVDGERQYRKGVKIEKNWVKDGKSYHQTSYWTHMLSRLITFVEIDGASPVTTEKLISFKIRDINEVPEAEYNANKNE